MRVVLLLFIFLSALFFSRNDAAKILGLFPHPGKSHQMVFEPLLKALAERNHHVTTVSFFPLKNPPKNYTDLSLENIYQVQVETLDLSMFEVVPKIPVVKRLLMEIFEFGPSVIMAVNVCEKVAKWEPLIEVLKKEYDVILLENFNCDCMLGLLHAVGNNAPKIALSSSNLMPWAAHRIGAIDNPAYVPVISTRFTSRMNFLERMENSFLNVYYKYWFHRALQMKERDIIQRQFGKTIPDLKTLEKNYSLTIVNTFHALNGIRPLLPALVEVGGMHLDHTRRSLPTVS